MSDAEMDGPDSDRLWGAEWWERLADARERWREGHVGTARTLDGVVRTALFVAFAVLVVTVSVSPVLRAGLGAWLGGAWLALLGFVLLRTKTIAWSTYWWIFTVALGWSFVASVGLGSLASSVSARGAEAAGPAVGIASIGEEALKLAPLLLIAVFAPGRVHRFSVADWVLVALASGAAFTAVEEFIRRVASIGLEGGGVPDSFLSFGVSGLQLAYDGAVAYPGHHAATGITGAAVGLGIALVRRARRDIGWRRAALLAAGVALPVLVWWLFVVRHAALNAFGVGVDLPGPMAFTEALLPPAWGRTLTVLLVLLLVQLVDARRLARWRDASLEDGPTPAWLDRLLDTTERWRAGDGPARYGAPVVESAGHLGHVVGRDVRQLAEVVGSQDGTNRWSILRSSRTLLAMQREMRQIVQHLDGAPSRPSVVRSVALVALVALGAVTLLVAPAVADDVQAAADAGQAWMAGLLQQLDQWWSGASFIDQVLFTSGTVAAASLSSAALGRSPGSLRETTPVGAVAALGHGALAAGLRVTGSSANATSPWVAETDRYLADPTGWRTAQMIRLSAPGA